MIRVVVCDDQDVVREGLRAIVGAAPGIEVVATASNGVEALEAIERVGAEVILMDLKMPVMNGLLATREIHSRFPGVGVLVLTTYDDDEWVFDAIRSGASGYLLKDTPAGQLIEAIRGTAAGKTHVDPSVAGKLFTHVAGGEEPPDATITARLSAREREVLCLLARGLSNTQIARKMFLSDGTVRNHLTSIFQKLGVSDRTQAAIVAVRHGLVGPKDS